jgi:glycosyltransferase involved in cell wall biosynthesis
MKVQKTKLGIIGTVGVPAKYGGFETLAHQLVFNLRDRFELTVYSSSKSYSKKERVKRWEGANIVYVPLKANGLQSIIYDIISMIHALFFCDAMLVLGVSGCIFLPVVKWFSGKKVVVNIDGLEWRRAKWSRWAKQFLIFSEGMAVRYADEIITDNAAIQKYVADHYGVNARLIEYGADQVMKVDITENAIDKYPFLNIDYAFKVCRIEPENNIHLVLEAFARYGKIPFVLVGNWNHSEYGKNLRALYRQYKNLHLLDPIYDQKELNVLRSNCTIYVHGHSAGGTNPSLVEAMYLELPVLAYGVIYNRITTENKALYFETVEDIVAALERLPLLQLDDIAFNMKWVADHRYTWTMISRKYSEAVEGTERVPMPVFDFELPLALQRAS